MKIEYKFWGRKGGVSKGLYKSLNINSKSCDNPKDVKENYRIIAEHFDLPSDNFVLLNQTHSSNAVYTDQSQNRIENADAAVTKTPNLIIGISTADCCPVLFFDETAKIIAGAHAGWRGAVGGILENTIKTMIEHGSKPENITACIGPCMLKPSFECQKDMLNEYLSINKNYQKFFTKKDNLHYLYDSEAFIVERLKIAGIKNIKTCGIDTYSDKENYFSYRRHCHFEKHLSQKPSDFGCQLSTIVIKE